MPQSPAAAWTRPRALRKSQPQSPAAPKPLALPPRHLCRTDASAGSAWISAGSKPHPTGYPVAHPRAEPPAQCPCAARGLGAAECRRANRGYRRSGAPAPLSRLQACFQRRYRPKADVSALQGSQALAKADRPCRAASPPRKHRGHCPKKKARPNPPDPVRRQRAFLFLRARGFRERQHALGFTLPEPPGSHQGLRRHVQQSRPFCPDAPLLASKDGQIDDARARRRPEPAGASVCLRQRHSL